MVNGDFSFVTKLFFSFSIKTLINLVFVHLCSHLAACGCRLAARTLTYTSELQIAPGQSVTIIKNTCEMPAVV